MNKSTIPMAIFNNQLPRDINDDATPLIGLEVGQSHDDALGIHRRREGGHALRDLLHVEVLRAGKRTKKKESLDEERYTANFGKKKKKQAMNLKKWGI